MKEIRPKTAEEYVRMVDQAIIDIEELIACYEYDMEDPGTHMRYLEPLIEQVRALRASMADGSYTFANKDLPFMELVRKHTEQLPFAHLLGVINDTHRKGLLVDED